MVVGRPQGEVRQQEGRVHGEAHRARQEPADRNEQCPYACASAQSPISGRLAGKGVSAAAQEGSGHETTAADAVPRARAARIAANNTRSRARNTTERVVRI
ncbi:hypothetical protein DL769_001558 [Monosporascus sp. CRB-8-3]|nr:hypothetical protein DL769_001558 [Monosporascus sp. CRB-8-3]